MNYTHFGFLIISLNSLIAVVDKNMYGPHCTAVKLPMPSSNFSKVAYYFLSFLPLAEL